MSVPVAVVQHSLPGMTTTIMSPRRIPSSSPLIIASPGSPRKSTKPAGIPIYYSVPGMTSTPTGAVGEPNKFERCVQHVKEKQSEWCAEHGYKRGVDPTTGKSCYNPWAVCHKSTGM